MPWATYFRIFLHLGMCHMEFSTQDTSFVSTKAFCEQGVACASAGDVSAVIVKFRIAKATLKTNPNLAPVRKTRNSSCCVQDES